MGKEVFGFVKPLVDVHTLGLSTIANLLKDCKYSVYIAPDEVNEAIQQIHKINNYGILKRWICENGITQLGFSYRLDPQEGCDYFLSVYNHLIDDKMFIQQGGSLKQIFFAGLPDTCELISGKTNKKIIVFPGDETPLESLKKLRIPEELLPNTLQQYNEYDDICEWMCLP